MYAVHTWERRREHVEATVCVPEPGRFSRFVCTALYPSRSGLVSLSNRTNMRSIVFQIDARRTGRARRCSLIETFDSNRLVTAPSKANPVRRRQCCSKHGHCLQWRDGSSANSNPRWSIALRSCARAHRRTQVFGGMLSLPEREYARSFIDSNQLAKPSSF